MTFFCRAASAALALVACSSVSRTLELPDAQGACERLVAATPRDVAPPGRAMLAAGLDSFLSEMVLSERSDFAPRATPYLTGGRIGEIEHFGHAHPFYAHLGKADGGSTVSLDSSKAFAGFARTAGLSLASNPTWNGDSCGPSVRSA